MPICITSLGRDTRSYLFDRNSVHALDMDLIYTSVVGPIVFKLVMFLNIWKAVLRDYSISIFFTIYSETVTLEDSSMVEESLGSFQLYRDRKIPSVKPPQTLWNCNHSHTTASLCPQRDSNLHGSGV